MTPRSRGRQFCRETTTIRGSAQDYSPPLWMKSTVLGGRSRPGVVARRRSARPDTSPVGAPSSTAAVPVPTNFNAGAGPPEIDESGSDPSAALALTDDAGCSHGIASTGLAAGVEDGDAPPEAVGLCVLHLPSLGPSLEAVIRGGRASGLDSFAGHRLCLLRRRQRLAWITAPPRAIR
jgi:hypothetical protein